MKAGEIINQFFKTYSENDFENLEEKMNRTGIFFKSNISEMEKTITNSNIMNNTSTSFTKEKNKNNYKGQYLNNFKHGKGIF